MPDVKSNKGVTLVELIVTIAIGSVITLAVVTLLLLGLRFHRHSTDTALRQNEIQIAITLMERQLAENPVTGISGLSNTEKDGAILTTSNKQLLSYNADSRVIVVGSTQILGNVDSLLASKVDSSIKLTLKVAEEDAPYTFTVYCRMMQIEETQPTSGEEPAEEGGATPFSIRQEATPEEITTQVLEDRTVPYGVRQFLQTLTSQLGSTGRIQTAEGEGEYFSQWYIGSYEANPGWSEETPWCACFVSWAMAKSSHLIAGAPMRFANVDAFWAELVTSDNWKTENPESGDIIFFDWIADSEPNPQHVGVVLTARDGWVYTVEGNTDGKVALRKYADDDTRILGCGSINWR